MRSAVDAVALAYDKVSIRAKDVDGHLHVDGTPISKAMVCGYYGREIPNAAALGLLPDKLYQLFRDPVELQKGAATFDGKPLQIVHKAQTADTHDETVVVGAVYNPRFDAPYLKADLAIWDGDAIKDVEKKVKYQLSCGYRYTPDMTPGVYGGVAYDGVMRNLIGNHCAIVEEGRAGPDVMVGDAKPRSMKMTTRKAALEALAAGFEAQLAALASDAMPAVRKTVAKLAKDAREACDEDDGEEEAMDEPMDFKGKPEVGGGKDKKGAKDEKDEEDEDEPEKASKDKKARDKKAADKKAADNRARDEKEEEEEEERKEREAEDRRARDRTADKKAMDAAIRAAIQANDQKHAEIREAAAAVRPIVGEVAMDSAEEIYRLGCEARGVDLTDVPKGSPAGVYKALLNTAARAASASPQFANDSATGGVPASFAKRFPNVAIPRRA